MAEVADVAKVQGYAMGNFVMSVFARLVLQDVLVHLV